MRAEDRFDELIAAMLSVDGVSPPAGGRALRHRGRIIAMLHGDRLAVKLSPARVGELVSEGAGDRFPRLRGWFVLAPSSPLPWLDLTKEALAHAQS